MNLLSNIFLIKFGVWHSTTIVLLTELMIANTILYLYAYVFLIQFIFIIQDGTHKVDVPSASANDGSDTKEVWTIWCYTYNIFR